MARDVTERPARTITPVTKEIKPKDENPDAITGAPGSHPVGTGIGAATAGIAGAAIGSVVPVVGTAVGGAVGAVVGAVFGGLVGKGVAESIDPTAEEAYWREEYRNRPYFRDEYSFDDDYAPAYMYGYQTRAENPSADYDDFNDDTLRNGWERAKAKSRLRYEEARQAMRDAWTRWDDREERP